ncbi:DUF748 domain-containing protein [Algibacter amylolyticus]|uniref:DUF748 domain-containing protein n=1 Tax=Algibacter amylolyticus TaxID=1608400 RepID=A0A5M7AY19_9FLAO|nr:DUF748 domain-containing protein [Algibacter amylolyticus]KAA5822346.1 DUF748 domain-containing protein [Algibacter amylolyticus]MBB5269063.1 hypothetical protein [Algibacter amylolyticus]TSJ73496.1 DUF748 domain-containing protein [Algibacter amylolyticus]
METPKNRKTYKKKRLTIPLIVLGLLVVLRFYLPTFVKNQINNTLADIPGYYGEVKDVDIALYRGAYVIDGMYLNKLKAKTEVQFLNFPKSDISIEWRSLFKGKIVSEIVMHNPEVIYVIEDQNATDADVSVDDWTKALTEIVPIDINKFTIHKGKIAYVELGTDPNIDLDFDDVELTATNLRNVVEKNRTLPSPIHATGVSIGGGKMTLDGQINLVKQIPDMDVSFALEKANVKALNDFTSHYAGIDFESGNFELFSEIAIADGHLKGYMKPLLENSKLIGKNDEFLEVLWEGLVGFFKFILKNQSTNTIATKIPLEGDLNNVEGSVWPTVINIFSNAWIKAFKGGIDDEIEFKDAFVDENKK